MGAAYVCCQTLVPVLVCMVIGCQGWTRRPDQLFAAYLFNVVVGDQALGLVLILHQALLLRLPPVVVGRLLQHHQYVALLQGDLIVALGGVVVDGPVDA
jgi:hypothetical protein